jgi:hypothetical protein
MKCWYKYCDSKDKFIIHEYVGLLKLGKCKNCGRLTIETPNNQGKPYQTYSKYHINDISETIISKWNDYNHFKLTFIADEKTGDTKLDIYYPYEGKLQGERIETLAFGNGLNVDIERLIKKDLELRNKIQEQTNIHNNSIPVKIWRLFFPLPLIPEYKIYNQ